MDDKNKRVRPTRPTSSRPTIVKKAQGATAKKVRPFVMETIRV